MRISVKTDKINIQWDKNSKQNNKQKRRISEVWKFTKSNKMLKHNLSENKNVKKI